MTNRDREKWQILDLFGKWVSAPSKAAAIGCVQDGTATALCRLALSDSGVKGEPEPVAWPANLNPRTLDLVQRFALALAKKLRLAEEKYGHTDGWLRDDWEAECRDHLYQHLEKGDPRDVAAYCAFMWHHGWITYRPEITAAPADAGMRKAFVRVLASLAAAISILERTPKAKKAVASDKMFDTMLDDYRKALEIGRAALTAPGATTKSDGGVEVITAEQMDAIETAAIAGQPLSNYSDYTPIPVRGSTSDPPSTRSEVTASLEGDAVERVAQTIREYCIDLSPASIQLSHGVERIYYAGLPVLELARAILATGLVPDEVAIRADEREKCAKIAESKQKSIRQFSVAADIAAAIRSGGGE